MAPIYLLIFPVVALVRRAVLQADARELRRLHRTNLVYYDSINAGNSKKKSAVLALRTYRQIGGSHPDVVTYWQEMIGFPWDDQSGLFDANTLARLSAGE